MVARSSEEINALSAALAIGLVKYPEERARLMKAFTICLDKGVILNDRGTHSVASGTTSGKTYSVGKACECPDYKGRMDKGEAGICKHRLAVSIQKRANLLLELLQHSQAARDTAAANGSLVAQVCNPDYRTKREAAGFYKTCGK